MRKRYGKHLTCPICGKTFYRMQSKIRDNSCCSPDCRAKSRKVEIPNKQYNHFFDHVMPIPECGCWIWMKGWGNNDYGKIWLRGKTVSAHRISWELTHGPIPEGLNVLHKCDVPPCVNPDHLFLGNDSDNIQDALKKGRFALGERSGKSKLSAIQAKAILTEQGTYAQIANKYGIEETTVGCIKRRETWKHVKAVSTSSMAATGRGRG